MTRYELSQITEERKYISRQLKILSPDNIIENQQRERLLQRLDYLEYKIDCALAKIQSNRLKVI